MRIYLLFLGMLFLSFSVNAELFSPYSVTTYNLTYNVSVENFGPADATDIPLRIAVLKDWEPVQKVKYLTINPKPLEIYNDSIGNTFATFLIPRLAPDEKFEVEVNASLEVFGIDFNVQPHEIGVYDTKDPNYTQYILPSRFIESDDYRIINASRSLLNGSQYVLDLIFKSYLFVIDYIEYARIPGELGALYAIKNKEGDSAEFSNLFVALLRANKIPARRISGWGESFSEGGNYTSNSVAHGWSEFYLPAYGWIPTDPTFGRLHSYDNFAKNDDKHIILTKGSGVHFYTRGVYNTPYGAADLITDYEIYIHTKEVKYLSIERTIVISLFFLIPLLFVIFLAVKYKHE